MQYTLTIRKAAALGNGTRQPGDVLATLAHEGGDVKAWLEQTVRSALGRDRNPAELLADAVTLADGARWEELTMAALNPQVVRYDPVGGPPAAEAEPMDEPAAETTEAPQEPAPETPAQEDEPDERAFLESKTKAELVKMAVEEGLQLDPKLNKADMVDQMLAFSEQASTEDQPTE